MSWKTKRNSAVGFLNSLEQFGMERNLSLRVLDSIRELKAETEGASEQSMERILSEVEPLLKHMGKKYRESEKTEIVLMQGIEDTISMEDVTDRIREIIDSCLGENQEKIQIYINDHAPAVSEVERQLREIQHTRAHYGEIKNVGRFQNFCNQVETKYNESLSRSLKDFAESLCQSCSQAVTKVRGILTKIKDEKIHVADREFWVTYDNKADLVNRRIRSAAGKMSEEQKSISRWAFSLIPKLNRSKRKFSAKKIIGILAPWLGILALALSVGLISKMSGEEGNSVLGLISDLPNEVLLLAIVLYVAVYIPFILKKSRNRFCDEVAGYLTPELEKFLREADFSNRMTESCENLKIEAEQACQEILKSVLEKTEIPETMQIRQESEEFLELCSRWESIVKTA